MTSSATVLPVEALYTRCDPDRFGFETMAELEDIDSVPGQARAQDAVSFGIGIRREGFNVFALGPSGVGKFCLIEQHASRAAGQQPVPDERTR